MLQRAFVAVLAPAATFGFAQEPADNAAELVSTNGKVVHEEALTWDLPGDPIHFDVRGDDD